jgi:hypothetical protein
MQTIFFRTDFHTLETHHAIILDYIFIDNIISYFPDSNITGTAAVAATGAFGAIFTESENTEFGKDIMECTHGTKETEKTSFIE